MGGLATGIALGKQDTRLRFTIASANSALPGRISLWSNGVKVLNSLGLAKKSPALADRWTAWRTTIRAKNSPISVCSPWSIRLDSDRIHSAH